MTEFLSPDEIDALLDIAGQGEDIDETQNVIQIINFSHDLVDNIQKNKRVQVILNCSEIINYIDSILKEYNLNISDIISYNYKSKENDFYIKMPRSSEESKERLSIREKADAYYVENLPVESFEYNDVKDVKLGYSLKELEDPKTFQESLDILNRLEVDIVTGYIKLKDNK